MRRSENSRERRASASDTLRPNELKSAELSKKKENHVSDALKREYANEKKLEKKTHAVTGVLLRRGDRQIVKNNPASLSLARPLDL